MFKFWPFGREKGKPPAARDTTEVLREEFEHLAPGEWVPASAATQPEIFRHIHDLPTHEQPTALCLSGGGIRSATFCLGVLQALAGTGRLQRFHYLSTVSGGGYIGSWLSNWRKERRWDWSAVLARLNPTMSPGLAAAAPAGGTDEAEHDAISRLRSYSNYLSPVWGLSTDSLSLVAIFLRNLLLNWMVWVPLLAGAVALPRLYVALLAVRPANGGGAGLLAAIAMALVVAGIAYVVADLPGTTLTPDAPERTNFFATCCFAPVALASILLSVSGSWAASFHEVDWWYFPSAGVLAHVVGIGLGIVWRALRKLEPRPPASPVGAGMVLLTGAIGGWLLWAALHFAGPAADAPHESVFLYATLSVPMMLACFWLAMSIYAGLVGRATTEGDREWWSRATAWWLYASVGWLIAFGLVIYLPPLIFDQLSMRFSAGAQLGVGGALLGVITSALGYWGKNGSDLKRHAQGILQATGLRVLDIMAAVVIVSALIGLSLLVSWTFETCHSFVPRACALDIAAETSHLREEAMLAATAPDAASAPVGHSAAAQAYLHVLIRPSVWLVASSVAVLLLFAVGASWLIGANTFSLHGMYGNRLVRAYLGAGRRERHPHWFTGFDPDDNERLANVLPPKGDPLFPVINIALNLVRPSSQHLAWQQRKASSFTASPLHCGADGVGYVTTQAYGDEKGMSLGRALTISGAAASPNMGYHSSGLVTFVMTLFNVRLGWWLPNPALRYASDWKLSEPRIGFRALFNEAFGRTTDDRPSVYLSDGGHFENLGLYEMVRRRCHRIVVIDASCDPKFEYADLQDAVRKIRVDFGVSIELPPVLPGPGRATPHARRVVGRIRYSMRDGNPPEADGYLYLVKPRMTGNEPPDLAQYLAAAGDDDGPFPHQSTADQFFDETQFESYRVLGLWSGRECFSASEDEWPDEDPRELLPPLPGANLHDRSEEAPAAGMSGLTGAVHNFGTGAALATALTVGGTLGVVGSVTMAPGEVRLSAEDREILQKGIKVNLAVDSGQLQLREIVEGAQGATRGLQIAAEALQEAADRLQKGSGGAGEPDAIKVLGDILTVERQVQVLLDRMSKGETLSKAAVDSAVGAVNTRLDQLVQSVNRLAGTSPASLPRVTQPSSASPAAPASGPSSLTDVVTELRAVRKMLDDLQRAVAGGNPRANVRGQEGGQR